MTRFLGVFLFLLIIPISVPVFGLVEDFSTDKSLYNKGDQLTISGNVSFDPEIPFVTIQIFTPGKSNFADFNTVPANPDGGFSAVFHVGGPTWASNGNYPIKVTYDGHLEKSIEYQENSSSSSEPEPPSSSEPQSSSEPETPESQTPETSPPSSTPTQTPVETNSFTTLKFKIPNFPALDKSPQYYLDRYNNEPNYKSWFDSQFPFDSIHNVVGYPENHLDGFPALDKSPQHYLDRYNTESSYKSWFDSQFPNTSIYHVLGYEEPVSVPNWIRNNAEWWAIGKINDSVFVTGIEYMIENNIIMVSGVSPTGSVSEDDIPDWVRNSAHWWSQDLISEDEFVNSLKYLIEEGIIVIN